jgi:predicted alpha/beta-fold hydrolase
MMGSSLSGSYRQSINRLLPEMVPIGGKSNNFKNAMNYVAPLWLPGGNLQTIWPALYAQRAVGSAPKFRRERWTTPDNDFVDVDWLEGDAKKILLVLFHGLEGSSQSHYALSFADYAKTNGWSYAVPHFRGCSGELNLAPRAYHSGDYEEMGWILSRFRSVHQGPIMVVGISLGGNALMKWAAEMGGEASKVVNAVASVCSPLDLAASGKAIGRGFNRMVYTRMFLNSMKPKALRKLKQHPGLFNAKALLAAKNLYEFDDIFTAPLHGFKNTEDYWARASAKPHLHRICIPALALNARNDPFVPAGSLPRQSDVGPSVHLWQPLHGGHVGFASGRIPGHLRNLPDALGSWFQQVVPKAGAQSHG